MACPWLRSRSFSAIKFASAGNLWSGIWKRKEGRGPDGEGVRRVEVALDAFVAHASPARGIDYPSTETTSAL